MIGDKIKRIRLEKKMSISKLAQQTGIAKSYLSTIERHLLNNPSIQILEKIACGLNVSVETLLFEKTRENNVDEEWIDLIKEAIHFNLSKEQFREFLEFHKWKNKN